VTIRRRLSLSFAGIMTLFAIDAGVYVWSNQRRAVAVGELQRAITRETLLASVQITLNDTEKQIGVLSQIAPEAGAAGASAADQAQFAGRLDAAEKNLGAFRILSGESPQAAEFEKAVRELGASWRVVYDNFGVNQVKAIVELATRADPLSRRVIQQLMPALQASENQLAERAGENFRDASRISDETTLSVFLLSALAAALLAGLISRNMTSGLTALNQGVEALGSGQLGHRISLARNDEFGELAQGFNQMSARLAAAQQELTKAQDQLMVQQKMASLGTLTAGIAHEIKNPLNFVNNFAEISLSMVEDLRESLNTQKSRVDPKELEFIEETLASLTQNATKIREHGRRADGIVKGMLMHSRGQRGQPQPTDLNGLVAEYVKLAYHGIRAQDINFNVAIEESYDPALPELNVVPHDLSRVILNLANNACYAADQRAKRAEAGFRPTLKITTRGFDGGVEIRIRDNGDGIAGEIQKKVFEPFFTTKPAGSGTGLGLSMSYEIIVQEHKGQIRVESTPGEYAEFIVTLPRT
jgi:signal transduction histidine kinase